MRDDWKKRIDRAMQAIEEGESILISGGAGLSSAAGMQSDGAAFAERFAPFIEKYGLTDLFASVHYPFGTLEERWAYLAAFIGYVRDEAGPAELYKDLFRLVKHKAYFVITTNADGQFEKAGFPAGRLFEIAGNYGRLQCAIGCHGELYLNERLVKAMIAKTVDCAIPADMVPQCPVCGGETAPNVTSSRYFVRDEKWYEAEAAYKAFVLDSVGKMRVFMELGVEHSPSIRLTIDHAARPGNHEVVTIDFAEPIRQVLPLFQQT
ncbi:SIR2 family NAD-dependent protein deacylase [Paenibacillus arenilitoris]|uniref:Sir2 silent information regulator family NAD-dependent deacetylase n=1 Tax=Paenibacillus arenilitoris TaxID=2772299 RepID=A0A927CV46_9BACL|nr:Sir2 silent information regulator family NAD-dependent deacetylase [Paenibacillus arenilitoris]MBD2872766.1 Sir2 silent information regulator family NAD-dependent deacetylase [Paenibacillus arenilitoris]